MTSGWRLSVWIAGTLLLTGTASAAPAWRKPGIGAPFGINVHQLVWDGPNAETQALGTLGADWIRVDFPWSQIEPAQGTFDFTVTDGIIANADALGINVYATLGGTPQWATDGAAEAGVPRDPADWDAFVYAVVSRYSGSVKYWGMWNEPNLTQFWSGNRDDYINVILSVGHDAAKRADPDCSVLGPELAHLKSADWSGWLNDVLTRAGGDIDIVTQHAYGGDASGVLNELDGPQWPWDPPNVRDVITGAGAGNKPFWLTETGFTTNGSTGEADQDAFYSGILNGMLTRPWWDKIFFYEIEDAPNTTDLWGLLRGDHSPKPAFATYQGFIAAHQPVPGAPARLSGVAGEPVTFDGSGSTEGAGTIASLTWDFDESDGVGVDATGPTVSHVYPAAGSYTAVLTVTNSYGYAVFERIAVEIDPAPTGTSSSSGSTSATTGTSSSSSGSSTATSSGSSGATGTSSSGSTSGTASSSSSSSSSGSSGAAGASASSGSGTGSGSAAPVIRASEARGGCGAAGSGDFAALGALALLLARLRSRWPGSR